MQIICVMLASPIKGYGSGDSQIKWLIEYFVRRGHEIKMIYLERAGYDDLSAVYSDEQRILDHDSLMQIGITEVRSVPDANIHMSPESTRNPIKRIMNSLRYRKNFASKEKEISENLCSEIDKMEGDVCLWFTDPIRYFGRPVKFKSTAYLPSAGRPHPKIKIDLGIQKIFGSTILAKLHYPILLLLSDRQLRRQLQYCENAFVAPKYFADLWRNAVKPTVPVFSIPFATKDLSQYLSGLDTFEPPINKPYRVAIFGGLSSAHGLPGILLLIDEIMPALQKRGLENDFEFVHIGTKFIYPHLAKKVYNSGIKLLGFLPEDQFAETLNRADIVLIATPVPPGCGSRIQAACAANGCVVVHKVVEDNYPEIENNKNCLTATTGDEFANAFVKICTDRELSRRLRMGARQTYLENYNLELGGRAFELILQDTAAGKLNAMSQTDPNHYLNPTIE